MFKRFMKRRDTNTLKRTTWLFGNARNGPRMVRENPGGVITDLRVTY